MSEQISDAKAQLTKKEKKKIRADVTRAHDIFERNSTTKRDDFESRKGLPVVLGTEKWRESSVARRKRALVGGMKASVSYKLVEEGMTSYQGADNGYDHDTLTVKDQLKIIFRPEGVKPFKVKVDFTENPIDAVTALAGALQFEKGTSSLAENLTRASGLLIEAAQSVE